MGGASHAEALQGIPLFADLDAPALERVARVATEVEVPSGHVLMERGHEGSGLFVLLEGSAEVDAGERRFTCGPGDFLGELSLLADGIPHTARVRTTSPVRCLAIRRDDFAALLEDEPRIAAAMLPVLARRQAETLTGA